MTLFGICAIVVLAAFLAVLLRNQQPEQALSVELLAGLLIVGVLLWRMQDIIQAVNGWMRLSGLPAEYLGVVVRAVGICLLTQLAADTCRDAGEQALASKAELAGKCFLMLLALPLFDSLLNMIAALIRRESML